MNGSCFASVGGETRVYAGVPLVTALEAYDSLLDLLEPPGLANTRLTISSSPSLTLALSHAETHWQENSCAAQTTEPV